MEVIGGFRKKFSQVSKSFSLVSQSFMKKLDKFQMSVTHIS